MIIEFSDKIQRDAHSQFQAWRRSNPNGYFLTQKSDTKFNLHQVNCHHCGNTSWEPSDFNGRSLTSSLKVCSTDRAELEAWLTGNRFALKPCGTCFK